MYKLTILARSGVIAKAQATSVILPTDIGEIDVLDNHRQYCGTLKAGVVKYKAADASEAKAVEIKEGFAEFSGKELTVFATV